MTGLGNGLCYLMSQVSELLPFNRAQASVRYFRPYAGPYLRKNCTRIGTNAGEVLPIYARGARSSRTSMNVCERGRDILIWTLSPPLNYKSFEVSRLLNRQLFAVEHHGVALCTMFMPRSEEIIEIIDAKPRWLMGIGAAPRPSPRSLVGVVFSRKPAPRVACVDMWAEMGVLLKLRSGRAYMCFPAAGGWNGRDARCPRSEDAR